MANKNTSYEQFTYYIYKLKLWRRTAAQPAALQHNLRLMLVQITDLRAAAADHQTGLLILKAAVSCLMYRAPHYYTYLV